MKPMPNPGAARKQILDDHRQIGELLSKLAAVNAAEEATACLQRLQPLLTRHFKEEEDEIDGLHAAIQKQTPHHVNALQGLKDEHRQLLERVQQMLAFAQGTTGNDPQLGQQGTQLKNLIAAHEAKETEIFVDSIWTDLGVGD